MRVVVTVSGCGSSPVEVFHSIFPRMNHNRMDGVHLRPFGQLNYVVRLNSLRIMSSYLMRHYGMWTVFGSMFYYLLAYVRCSGDWAGAPSVWNQTSPNGQTGGSCASRTGYSTCVDYVREQGAAFAEACEYFFHRACGRLAHVPRLQFGKFRV